MTHYPTPPGVPSLTTTLATPYSDPIAPVVVGAFTPPADLRGIGPGTTLTTEDPNPTLAVRVGQGWPQSVQRQSRAGVAAPMVLELP